MSYNSPHAALAHAVQATIVALIGGRLTGLVADSVRVRKAPWGADFTSQSPLPSGMHAYPCLLIVYGDKERDFGGGNRYDDVGYPLTIVFVAIDKNAQGVVEPEANDDTYLTWRQTISDVFRNQPYNVGTAFITPGITFETCTIEYGPIVDWSRWQKDQLFAGSFTLVFRLRKGRG